jgi:hypothetical protein
MTVRISEEKYTDESPTGAIQHEYQVLAESLARTVPPY